MNVGRSASTSSNGPFEEHASPAGLGGLIDEVGTRRRALRWIQSVLRFARRKPLGATGAVIVLLMLIVAAAAGQITQHDPLDVRVVDRFQSPNSEFWFGTDQYGRDLFTRIVYGARVSLTIGFLSVLFGTTGGALLGLISGYYGGKVDTVIQRIMDSLMAFPTLVLALAVVAALGQSRFNVILAIAVVLIPTASRVIRSSVLSIRQHAYVEAARSIGCPNWRILFVHILPNCAAPFIILATVSLGSAIISESSLSFLGLGTPLPEPSWGSMLTVAAQRYIRDAPWMGIFPGIAISLAVFAFNMLGDALRDVLDPRLRSR